MIKYIDVEQVEIDLLLEAILRVYGYDFRHYARASLKRRLEGFLKKKQCHQHAFMTTVLDTLQKSNP